MSYEEFYYSSPDGLTLYGRKYGWENTDPCPVLCLAGITRNSSDFDTLAVYLSSDAGGNRRVLALDYRGRGKSEFDADWRNYTIFTEADDVLAGLLATGVNHVDIVGTSRGGLVAMVLAGARPGIINSITLNDIGPELNGPGLVQLKRTLERSEMPNTLEAAADSMERAYRKQFPNLSKEDWKKQADLVYRETGKRLEVRYDRKLVNTLKSINLDVRLADMWPQFAGITAIPTLLIHGKLSDLLNDTIIKKMHTIHTTMKLHMVPDEGHAPLLADTATHQAISNFLSHK